MPQIIPAAIAAGAAAAGFAGAATTGVLTTTFTLAGFTITYGAALSAGLSLLSAVSSIAISALTAPRAAKPTATASQTTFQDATAARFFTFGRVRRGGALVFWETTFPDGQGNLYRLIVTDCQETDAVEARLINGEQITLDGSGFVTSPSKWADRIQILSRSGTATQVALPQMLGAFDQWTEDHRLRGLSYVMIRQIQVGLNIVQDVYPNFARGETYTETARGAKIYDPRDGVTRWTRNAALVLLWALTHPQFGALSLDDMAIETWKAAADACDAIIVSPDGIPEAAYTISGQIQAGRAGSELASTISDMLACMDGTLFEDPDDDGKIALRIGVATSSSEPPLGIDDIVSLSYQEGPGLISQYDAVRVEYTEPGIGFESNISPAYGLKNDGTLGFLTSDDTNSSNILTLQLPMIDANGQAQRIAKKAYLRIAAGRTATVQTNLAGLLYVPGETLSFDLPILPPGEAYRVIEKQIDTSRADGEVSLEVELISPEYMFWSEADGVPLKVPPLLNASGVIIDPPSSLRAAAFSAGNIRVAWALPAYPSVSVQIEWGNAGSGVFGDSLTVAAASTLFAEITTGFANVDIRARFSTGSGQFTAYTTITNISASALLSAPPAPTISGTTISESPVVAYTVTPGAVTGIWKARLYVDGIFRAERAVGDTSPVTVNTPGLDVGRYRITARTMNLSGVESGNSNTIIVDIIPRESGGRD